MMMDRSSPMLTTPMTRGAHFLSFDRVSRIPAGIAVAIANDLDSQTIFRYWMSKEVILP